MDISKKYNVINADPPWTIKTYSNKGKDRSPEKHYSVMTLQDIKDLPVNKIANDDSVLLMWVVDPLLDKAFEVINAWGFKYSTTLIWTKKPRGLGLGGTFTTNAEYLLLAYRGKQNALKKHDSCWWELPRSYHSKKPDFFRDMIAETYDDKEKKIELFAREKTEGWDVWGNEV